MNIVIVEDVLNNKFSFTSQAEAARFIGCDESSVRKAAGTNRAIYGKYKVYRQFNSLDPSPDNTTDITSLTCNTPGLHLVFGCVHSPYANMEVLNKIQQLTFNTHFVGIHVIGDFTDLTSLSAHDFGKLNKGMTLSDEYREGKKILEMFSHIRTKTYLQGNHEFRYVKHLKSHEASKYGTALKSVVEGLDLTNLGYQYISGYSDNYIQLGDLQLIHGMYTTSNHGKTHLSKVRQNVMYVHTHNFGVYSENGISAYNIGFLGDIDAPIFSYVSRFEKANWKNGFAVVYLDRDGTSFVQMVEVKYNKFMYNNQIY